MTIETPRSYTDRDYAFADKAMESYREARKEREKEDRKEMERLGVDKNELRKIKDLAMVPKIDVEAFMRELAA